MTESSTGSIEPTADQAMCAIHTGTLAVAACSRCHAPSCVSCYRPDTHQCQMCAGEKPRQVKIAPLHALVAIIVGAFSAIIGSTVVSAVVAGIVAASTGKGFQDCILSLPAVAASLFVTGISLIGSGVVAAKVSKVKVSDALGFNKAPWPCFILAPLGIVALGPTSEALVKFAQRVVPDWTFGALDQLAEITSGHPWWMLWPLVALIPGVAEEVFFRGLVQRAIGAGVLAISVSAIFFSVFHMDPHHVLGVLPLGFYLSYLGARTGSTWVPISAHIVNNSLALAGSQIEALGEAETPPWAMFVGWLIAAVILAAIYWLTRDREQYGPPTLNSLRS